MKDTENVWTDNVRPAAINVNWLRMVHAQLPVRCPECSGTGREPTTSRRGRARKCEHCGGAGTILK